MDEERNYIGIMPLSGKLINVKKVTIDRISANKEFKRILTTYKKLKKARKEVR